MVRRSRAWSRCYTKLKRPRDNTAKSGAGHLHNNEHHITTPRIQEGPPPPRDPESKEEFKWLVEHFSGAELQEIIEEDTRNAFLAPHACTLHHTGIPDQPPPSYVHNAMDHIITEVYIGFMPILSHSYFMTRGDADAVIRDTINTSIDRGFERMEACAKVEEARHLEGCCCHREQHKTFDELSVEAMRYKALIEVSALVRMTWRT